jgi:hypothetical protein
MSSFVFVIDLDNSKIEKFENISDFAFINVRFFYFPIYIKINFAFFFFSSEQELEKTSSFLLSRTANQT